VAGAPDAAGPVPGAGPRQAGPQQPAARPRRGRSSISGRVTTVSGHPITGARVAVLGAEGTAFTNERGEFTLAGQPSGSQTVQVRKLGYEPAEFGVNLISSRPAEVSIELPEFVPVLSTVVVRAQMDVGLDRVGYLRRQRMGMGRFLSLEEIERRGATRLVDLLADLPMLSSVAMGGSRRVITGRARGMEMNCVIFYVDGMLWAGDDSPVEFVYPQEIAAIEAYSAANTPAEFSRTLQACETVVIWTKHRVGIAR